MGRPKKHMYICGVYAILNTETGETYIGSSTGLASRFAIHLSDMKRGIHPRVKIRDAVEEYGIEAFTFVVLEECEILERLIKEKEWIDYWQPEYNTVVESTLGPKGFVHTQEQNLRHSEFMRSEWTRRKALGLNFNSNSEAHVRGWEKRRLAAQNG